MEYVIVFGIIFIVIGFISWRWVEGIDYMHKNHPDYKGEESIGGFDFDDEIVPEEKNKKNIKKD